MRMFSGSNGFAEPCSCKQVEYLQSENSRLRAAPEYVYVVQRATDMRVVVVTASRSIDEVNKDYPVGEFIHTLRKVIK